MYNLNTVLNFITLSFKMIQPLKIFPRYSGLIFTNNFLSFSVYNSNIFSALVFPKNDTNLVIIFLEFNYKLLIWYHIYKETQNSTL